METVSCAADAITRPRAVVQLRGRRHWVSNRRSLLPAFALDLNVTLTKSPPRAVDLDAAFAGITPGEMRSVDVPCGSAPTYRLTVVVTPAPAPDRWLVKVDVAEVRYRLFGGEVLKQLSDPLSWFSWGIPRTCASRGTCRPRLPYEGDDDSLAWRADREAERRDEVRAAWREGDSPR